MTDGAVVRSGAEEDAAGSEGPLVSIIVPTHNRWPMVLGAVDSALSQEVGNVEVIVVDDGSTDGTADELAQSRPCVAVLRQSNRERGVARNLGLRRARGRYVVFLDADDALEPWYLRQFLERWTALGGSERVYVCGSYTWYADTGRLRYSPFGVSASDDLLLKALRGTIWGVHCAVIPRSAALAVGGFPESRDIAGSEDWVFQVRLLASGLPVEFLAKPAVRMREHAERSTNNAAAFLASRQAALGELVESGFPHRALDPEERRIAKAGTDRFCAAHSYLAGDMAGARGYLRAMRREVGLRVAVPWAGRLWLQTWLGRGLTARIRRVRDAHR